MKFTAGQWFWVVANQAARLAEVDRHDLVICHKQAELPRKCVGCGKPIPHDAMACGRCERIYGKREESQVLSWLKS